MHDRDRGNEPATLGVFGAISALVLCCFIVGILAYSSGLETSRRDKTPAAYSEAAKIRAQQDCAGRDGNAAFDCIYEKVVASQQQAHDEQDLSAQQKSANGTMLTAAFAFLGLIVSAVGIGLVYTTFKETRKANDINLEIGQAQVRAYLSIVSARLIVTHTLPFWEVIIKNSGQSPAAVATLKIVPEMSYMDFSVLPDGQPLTALDFSLSEASCGSLAPGETRDDINIMCMPSGKGKIPENLGAIIVDPATNCVVSATFFLKWIDVFGVECDSSGSIIARKIHPTESNNNGIIGCGDGGVSTSVYDTAAWFDRWNKRNNKD